MNTAIGLAKGLTNRQISQQMFLAEKTVKNMVSSVLTQLGMASRSQAAVFIARALDPRENPADGYRISPFQELIAELTAALLDRTSDWILGQPEGCDVGAGAVWWRRSPSGPSWYGGGGSNRVRGCARTS